MNTMTLQCMYFGISVRAFSSYHQTAEALILITLLIIFEPNRLTALFVCAVLVKLHTRDMYLTTLSRVFPFFVSLLVSRHFFFSLSIFLLHLLFLLLLYMCAYYITNLLAICVGLFADFYQLTSKIIDAIAATLLVYSSKFETNIEIN